jgi:processive 1,2-diacylglycerol beta-glucosyltransferase
MCSSAEAGGATVQEALAARTPMIITQVIPGQEEGNAMLLVENGAGEIATTPGGDRCLSAEIV